MRRAVIIGGAGAVGRWMTEQLAPVALCVALDPRAKTPDAVRKDFLSLPPETAVQAMAGADAVVLAVPVEVAIAALAALAEALPPACTVVELLSAKSAFHSAAARSLPGRPVLGLNPLFRPEMGSDTGSVLCVRPKSGSAACWIEAALSDAGQSLIVTTADAHDRVLGTVQALVHATALSFGAALRSAGQAPGERQTPPFRCLAALFARVVQGEPHVYWEIQRHNPYAVEARRALLSALEELDALATAGDAGAFTRWLETLSAGAPVDLDAAGSDAAWLFAALRDAETGQTPPVSSAKARV
jgi:prephenate dehydrogenase